MNGPDRRWREWFVSLVALALFGAVSRGPAAGHPIESLSLAPAKAKSPLKVLYVGPDPDQISEAPTYVTGEAARRWGPLVRERMPAFEAFLEEHFETVGVVPAKEYDASQSLRFDVTVFDALPEPLAVREIDGWPKKLRLPEDFDLPAVTVGDVGPFMLGRFGFDLKLDHL